MMLLCYWGKRSEKKFLARIEDYGLRTGVDLQLVYLARRHCAPRLLAGIVFNPPLSSYIVPEGLVKEPTKGATSTVYGEVSQV